MAVVVGTPDRSTPRRRADAAGVPRRPAAPAHAGDGEGTDDAALVEAIGGRVVVVPGEPDNRKITVPDDLDWARQR